MRVVFTWKELIILNDTKEIKRFPASSKVRNEINGQRRNQEIVYTYPLHGNRTPYYPRPFPSGIFEITEIEWVKDPDRFKQYGPVIIKTNATRKIFTWDLDSSGHYWKLSGEIQTDSCYYIHHTHRFFTTLGCIRGGDTESEMISIAQLIEPVFEHGDKIYLEVL